MTTRRLMGLLLAGLLTPGCSLVLDAGRHQGGTPADAGPGGMDAGPQTDAAGTDAGVPGDGSVDGGIECSIDSDCPGGGFLRCIGGTCESCELTRGGAPEMLIGNVLGDGKISLTVLDPTGSNPTLMLGTIRDNGMGGPILATISTRSVLSGGGPTDIDATPAGDFIPGSIGLRAINETDAAVVVTRTPGMRVTPEPQVAVGTFRGTFTPITLDPFGNVLTIPGRAIASGSGGGVRLVWQESTTAPMTALNFGSVLPGAAPADYTSGSLGTVDGTRELVGSDGDIVVLEGDGSSLVTWDASSSGNPDTLDTPDRTTRPALAARYDGTYLLVWASGVNLNVDRMSCSGSSCGMGMEHVADTPMMASLPTATTFDGVPIVALFDLISANVSVTALGQAVDLGRFGSALQAGTDQPTDLQVVAYMRAGVPTVVVAESASAGAMGAPYNVYLHEFACSP